MKRTNSAFSRPLRALNSGVILASAFALLIACKNGKNAESETKEQATTAATASTAASTVNQSKAPPQHKGPEPIPAPADVAAAPADAEKSATGLASKVLTKGTGSEHPSESSRVKVHYTGWSKDGKMFDSSVLRGQPATFGLNQVIKGWTEGVQLMVVGEKRRFWIPGELAYGEVARRPGAPSGQLTFDVELLEIIQPPTTPEDVAAPSAGSKTTASGLAYKVLKQGDGEVPTPDSRVTVHYSGWTKDGKMFDSSIMRERPATFGVKGVIPGWTEGLQLMKAGSKYRFWIPGKLAYGDKPTRPGAPVGQLTFDVELISVQTPPPRPAPSAASKPAPAPASAPKTTP